MKHVKTYKENVSFAATTSLNPEEISVILDVCNTRLNYVGDKLNRKTLGI